MQYLHRTLRDLPTARYPIAPHQGKHDPPRASTLVAPAILLSGRTAFLLAPPASTAASFLELSVPRAWSHAWDAFISMETPQVPRYRPESHWPSIQGWLCGYSSTEWTSAVLVEAMFRTETLCSAVSRILQVPSPPHPNGHESDLPSINPAVHFFRDHLRKSVTPTNSCSSSIEAH